MPRFLIALFSLVLIATPAAAQNRGDRAHKPGSVKKGEVVLHARKTPYEQNEERFMAEYVQATMSFEFATRDDMKAVNNDWDVCLQGLGTKDSPFHFIARTVTNDESRIWALGAMSLDEVTRSSLRSRQNPPALGPDDHESHLAWTGNCYLVHTIDDDSDLWAAFRVVDLIPGESVRIEWKLIGTPRKIRAKTR